jgi:nucleotide-binding universal stress UspA family protein
VSPWQSLRDFSGSDTRFRSLMHAWAPYAEGMVRRHAAGADFDAYVESARRRAEDDLARLTASFGDRLAGVEATTVRDTPEDTIPEFVVAHGIDLVVMGTVGRSGISGMLIGNTAERVLRTLPCSVLAVKPEGFVSPVRLEGQASRQRTFARSEERAPVPPPMRQPLGAAARSPRLLGMCQERPDTI